MTTAAPQGAEMPMLTVQKSQPNTAVASDRPVNAGNRGKLRCPIFRTTDTDVSGLPTLWNIDKKLLRASLWHLRPKFASAAANAQTRQPGNLLIGEGHGQFLLKLACELQARCLKV